MNVSPTAAAPLLREVDGLLVKRARREHEARVRIQRRLHPRAIAFRHRLRYDLDLAVVGREIELRVGQVRPLRDDLVHARRELAGDVAQLRRQVAQYRHLLHARRLHRVLVQRADGKRRVLRLPGRRVRLLAAVERCLPRHLRARKAARCRD
ncbi:hypothetical protein [Burkholderia contaminans]|uniref:hypothetical protein n=1 Tax=Burkholderia contaminans TaxID=488447 RepID=UPI002D7E28E6|nr:hypothetical protein [Burkholderia contaminans]